MPAFWFYNSNSKYKPYAVNIYPAIEELGHVAQRPGQCTQALVLVHWRRVGRLMRYLRYLCNEAPANGPLHWRESSSDGRSRNSTGEHM